MVQRSDFPQAKIQGASGLALAPCVLFSVWLLVGCLVGGLAVAGVGGCGFRRLGGCPGPAGGNHNFYPPPLVGRPVP